MKKRIAVPVVLLLLIAGMIAVPGPAAATQHFMFIDEIFRGQGSTVDSRFVELRMWSGGQNQVAGSQLTLFGATGSEVQDIDLTQDVVGDTAGDSILIATGDAEVLFDVDADFQPSSMTMSNAGRACFGPDESNSYYDCVTWGDYTGPGAQNPINNPEGLIAGASFRRVYGNNGIDSGDDHNDNERDFIINTPRPRNNDGDTFDASQRIKLGVAPGGVQYPEDSGATLEIGLDRLGDTTGAVDVLFTTSNGTAGGPDYEDATDVVTFGTGQNHIDVGVNIQDDDQFEGPETVNLTIRGPSSPAFLAAPVNSQIIIRDFEDDTDSPKSRVTRPDHRESYKASKLDVIKGRANDGVGLINEVDIALRQKRTNGSCRWYNGERFVRRACNSKKFIDADVQLDGDWKLKLGDPLKKSQGTKVKLYTVYSRATDAGEPSNTESDFEKGRNANKFEIT